MIIYNFQKLTKINVVVKTFMTVICFYYHRLLTSLILYLNALFKLINIDRVSLK